MIEKRKRNEIKYFSARLEMVKLVVPAQVESRKSKSRKALKGGYFLDGTKLQHVALRARAITRQMKKQQRIG